MQTNEYPQNMNSDYDLVASAVQFYRANIHEQPGIDRVAAHLD